MIVYLNGGHDSVSFAGIPRGEYTCAICRDVFIAEEISFGDGRVLVVAATYCSGQCALIAAGVDQRTAAAVGARVTKNAGGSSEPGGDR